MAFTSCKKFLDVKPESQIDRDELFKTEQGFKEALNGIYTACASRSLYGGNLTFSNLDILAQNYQFGSDVTSQMIANFDYTQPAVIAKNNDIWASCYRAIANCNYILTAIDDKKSLFTGTNYELIKGETLTVRAYLHFDLLRMFATSFKAGPNAKGIPYVTTIGTTSTPFSTVSGALDKILTDLNAAKVLLKKADPIISSSYVVGYPGDVTSTETSSTDLFMQNRRHRMNYYSVCGELARVYLYKNDLTNSLTNALEVIDSKKFPFTNKDDIIQTDITKKDRIFYKELVSCWFVDTKDINSQLQALFSNTAPQYSGTVDQVNDIYEKAQSGADDLRLKQWFVSTAAVTGGPDRAVLQKYVKNELPLVNLHPLVAPAIRLSEMYYIAAEATFDTDPAKALDYFNTVRMARNIGNNVTPGDLTGKDDFINLLLKEARKEFYGESQMFYMYKRLNHSVTISLTQSQPASNSIFVFPLPVDEQAYRNN